MFCSTVGRTHARGERRMNSRQDHDRALEQVEKGGRGAETRIGRRVFLQQSVAAGAIAALFAVRLSPGSTRAQEVTCPAVATPQPSGTPMPMSGMKLGVTVAYLS